MQQLHKLATAHNCAHAFLFIDLTSAFDRVARRHFTTTTWPNTTISLMHRKTWGVTPYANDPYTTEAGVRQGDPMSDAAFLSVFLKLLNRLENYLADMGHEQELFLVSGSLLNPDMNRVKVPVGGVCDISYIDDVAILVKGHGCIFEELEKVANVTLQLAAEMGFHLNMKQGKTNAVIHAHGPGAAGIKTSTRERDAKIQLHRGQTLHVVTEYPHLGLKHSSVAQGRVRAHAFVKKLNVKAAENATALYARNMRLDARRKVLDICLAAASYAVGTWDEPTSQQYDTMQRAYMTIIRAMTRSKYNPSDKEARLTDDQVMKIYKFMPLDALFKLRRLQLLRRVLTQAPPSTKALVQSNAKNPGSWADTVLSDLEWAWSSSPKLLELGDPHHSTARWEDFIRRWPGQWQCILKEISKEARQGLLPLRSTSTKKDVPEHLEFPCRFCERCFTCEQARNLHMATSHSRISLARRYSRGAQCQHCKKDFGFVVGLQRHLRDGFKRRQIASCLGQTILAGHLPAQDEELQGLLEQQRKTAKENKMKGHHPDGHAPGIIINGTREERRLGALPRWAYDDHTKVDTWDA
eukprot:TRINITY_DN29152_c0_g3_i1.p1 TRINITY_DN29152_c0_g3~~TRINITY_DN29152_c0_g3_i1.p1  ORF type:complete len:580 (-),score=83.50 TRINITY_DN29152_c0_g3_i1:159-1898(-)